MQKQSQSAKPATTQPYYWLISSPIMRQCYFIPTSLKWFLQRHS